MKKIIFFEFLGTFILVFCGLSAVAIDVTTGGSLGLPGVAAVWGLALMAAIFICGSASGAHFNPAITIAMTVYKGLGINKCLVYIISQFGGAAFAALMVFTIYSGNISNYESENNIKRGETGSEASAMIFGEYFPNPGGKSNVAGNDNAYITPWSAFLAELMGTLLLAVVVFGMTEDKNSGRPQNIIPFAIGGSLTLLICLFAPISMAGFNPARDFAPRFMSMLFGWGSVPITTNSVWWFLVYGVAPVLGGLAGAGIIRIAFSTVPEVQKN